MRKAVVDVVKFGHEYMALRSDPVFTGNEGKLTKEDVEKMVRAYEFALDNRMNSVEAMVEAAGSIGIEVED